MTSEDEETAKQNISYGRFKTVYEALAPILSESQTTREQGAKYEALCAYPTVNQCRDEGVLI